MKLMRRMAALLAVAMLGAGCGGDDGGDSASDTTVTTGATTTSAAPASSTSTSTTLASTTTAVSTEEEVLAAYRNAWEQQRLASDPPDPEHEGMLATHAEPIRSRLIAALVSRQASGTAFRGSLTLHPRIESIDAGSAVVVDCIHEEGADVQLDSGRLFDPVDESVETWTTMVLEDGTWKRGNQRSGELCVP